MGLCKLGTVSTYERAHRKSEPWRMVLCILEVLDQNPKKATDPFPNKTATSEGKGTALHCQARKPWSKWSSSRLTWLWLCCHFPIVVLYHLWIKHQIFRVAYCLTHWTLAISLELCHNGTKTPCQALPPKRKWWKEPRPPR